MPYLRFSRDKRGYENTFVVHQERRRGKPRSRLLYWFRTPPGVKVGRAALDEHAIRLLEELNPDVEFDWTRILKGEGPPRAPEPPRPHGSRKGEHKRAAPPRPEYAPQREEEEEEEEEVVAVVPPSLEEEIAPVEEEIVPAIGSPVPETAAHARLGSESIVRLRGRYAEILTRITERIEDPVRRDELKFQADRLNPDTWVTDAEVTAGLEQYEAVFESLRAVVGRRKRRRRRRGGRKEPVGSTQVQGPGSGPEAGDALEPDAQDSDDAEDQ